MRARYVAIALAGYLVMLLVLAPSAWTAFLISRMSDGTLGVASPAGSFWSGRGSLYLRKGHPVHLGTLSWRLEPAALLLGRAQAVLTLAGPIQVHVTLIRSWGETALHGLSATIPAALLVPMNASLRLLKPSGRLRLQAALFTLTSANAKGRAALIWTSAGTALSTLNPLGDYRLRLQGMGPRMRFTLQTLRGALGLSGQGQWDRRGRFRFQGLATARGSDPRARRLVRLLGPRVHPRVHAFSVTAQTPPWKQFF
ncbi:MAG: type II secretion system protein N [Acidiferrobacteraceae bacterium]